jgi:hypothetical protein
MKRDIHACECAVCQAGEATAVVDYHRQINVLLSRLNEAQRRWSVGLLSQKVGSPTDGQLAQITGLDAKTIRRGRRELAAGLGDLAPDRQRHVGGGRPAAEKKTRNWSAG